VGRVEDRVPVPVGEKLAHELVQLAVERRPAVGHGHDVGVVQAPVFCPLDESGPDGHLVFRREA
jgi:hypothetical protein